MKLFIFISILCFKINYAREICDRIEINFYPDSYKNEIKEFSIHIGYNRNYYSSHMWDISWHLGYNYESLLKSVTIKIGGERESNLTYTDARFSLVIGIPHGYDKVPNNFDTIWVKLKNNKTFSAKIHFKNDSFVLPNGDSFDSLYFSNGSNINLDAISSPSKYKCVSFKEVSSKKSKNPTKQCEKFQSATMNYKNEFNIYYGRTDEAIRILEENVPVNVSVFRNEKNYKLYKNNTLLNCRMQTMITPNCTSLFPQNEEPTLSTGFLYYNDKKKNPNMDKFLYAAINAPDNNHIKRKGELFDEDCIQLLMLHLEASTRFMSSRIFCCQ